MLYLSTRNKSDSFTAHRVLCTQTAPDGGMYMPIQIPVMDDFALAAYESKSFSEAVSSILNLFFGTELTPWDIDFGIGRQAVELVSFGYRIALFESWHNPAGTHAYLVERLYALTTGQKNPETAPNAWFQTAVYIALLFGIYGKFSRQEIYEFDVAVETGDLQMMLAVRYAQKMGLPIQKVILGSPDGDGFWEFFSFGEYQTYRKSIPACLEALIWLEFGYSDVKRYLSCVERKVGYRLDDAAIAVFKNDVFTAVVGDYRVNNLIEGTLRTSNYRMRTDTARSFGALQDYRAKSGENKNTLLFARTIPQK